MTKSSDLLLEVNDLKMHFPIKRGLLRRTVGAVKAVDGVSFKLNRGETLGLVGESGCGKTTTGRCIVRAYEPTGGEIKYFLNSDYNKESRVKQVFERYGQQNGNGPSVDLTKLSNRELAGFREQVQMIFQDPYSSLNPRMTVLDVVSEPLIINTDLRGDDLKEEVGNLLRRVGLRPEYMNRYPNAFSGGQRQRIGIARSLALRPNLIVCDEPVSALDVSVQAQVVNLLQDLQSEFRLAYLFIAHDLSVVQHISNRVAVMYLGHIVELAESQTLYQSPLHPYTEALLQAVPSTNPDRTSDRIILTGDVPNPADPPSGCVFHPRCLYAKDVCKQEAPAWQEVSPGHFASCHFADSLTLRGAV